MARRIIVLSLLGIGALMALYGESRLPAVAPVSGSAKAGRPQAVPPSLTTPSPEEAATVPPAVPERMTPARAAQILDLPTYAKPEEIRE